MKSELFDRIAFLKTTNLFAEVPESLLMQISESMQPIEAKAGTIIFREGDEGDAVYLVVRGTVGIGKDDINLLTRSSGECFGEFALLDEGLRSASAVTETEVLLLKWKRKDFQKALSQSGEAAYSIFKILTGKLRQTVTIQVLNKQRQIAAQLREKLRQQEEAERIQEAKMESLRQLVAGVAHEMNNPIGVILGNNDVSSRAIDKIKEILTGEYPQEISENKQLIRTLTVLDNTTKTSKTASERIAKIVATLRRFVRLDEAEWQIADIHEGIDNAIALMEMEPEFKNIKVTKDYGDIPKIYCSPSNLNQVFRSMLRNASEAIEEEGAIQIKTFAQQEHVKIEISDTGRGIPAEYIPRIFDPGFTTKGVRVGVGLGLSICYQIVVDEHKGRADVSSELGKGTTFTITLPQHPVAKR